MSITTAWHTVPARIAELGFRVELPADWVSHPLPEESLDFDDPRYLVPLAVLAAPQAAIVFSCAARPAYDSGSLHDWAWYLLRENGLEPQALGEHRVGPLPALVGEAVQDSGLGPMRVRFAFTEDGGRLLNLSLGAPEFIASAVVDTWFRALASFTLETPRGATVALMPVVQTPVPGPVEPPVIVLEPDVEPPDLERAVGRASGRHGAARPVVGLKPDPQPDSRAVGARLARDDRAPAPPDGPAWWQRALAFEREDRLDAAEQVIREAVPNLHFAQMIAELYRYRMQRLGAAGDRAGALVAYEQADAWIHFLAVQATSGGEGVALSRERDVFLAALRAERPA